MAVSSCGGGGAVDNAFEIPDWSGRAPDDYYVDVFKNGDLIDKINFSKRTPYYCGRNSKECCIRIDHESCSRVHSCIIFHSVAKQFFIVDLNSTHGTYLDGRKLEAFQITYLPLNTEFHFGASTRKYSIGRVKKRQKNFAENSANIPNTFEEIEDIALHNKLKNQKLYHNFGAVDFGDIENKARSQPMIISFTDKAERFNFDPNLWSRGLFKGLATVMIKKNKEAPQVSKLHPNAFKREIINIPATTIDNTSQITLSTQSNIASRLGIRLPSLAPKLAINDEGKASEDSTIGKMNVPIENHKKYAKEHWPQAS
ncbi:MAG: Nuclear inhibitor of protein phosphatase 1 [Marteilia pararefringens]